MGYRVKDKYTLEDLIQPGVVIEGDVKSELKNYDTYSKIFEALCVLTGRFPEHEIVIRKIK